MNAARMGVLVLAVVAAGLAALLARGLMAPAEAPVQQAEALPKTHVLVAATDIERGRQLSSGDFRWQPWPGDSVSPTFITQAQRADAITALTGSIARSAMANGEPVTDTKIVDLQKGGLMSALIGPGMRAVAITISPESGVGGFILPDDRVDIILTHRTQEKTEVGPKDVIRGDTIMKNIRVLAIDQNFKAEGTQGVAVGKTATVELTATQAEELAIAQAEGAVSLSLRGIAENNAQVTGDTPKEPAGSMMRVVRYGIEKSVRVK